MSDLTPAQRTEILERHLHDHGLVDPDDVDAAVAAAESASGDGPSPALGARVVARAWVDAQFRARLLADPVNTVAEYQPQTVPIAVLEDTPSLHHVIVCTLCSCYPGGLLGNPPAWYKSFEYRSRGGARTADGAGRVRHRGRARRRVARPRLDRRAALPRPPAAPGRHRGLERGAARWTGDTKLDDRNRPPADALKPQR